MRIAVPRDMQHTGDDANFCVVVFGFEPHSEAPIVGLRRVFGLDQASASAVLAALPATVCRGVNRARAEYFGRALRSIGARVEVRDENATHTPNVSVPANDVREEAPLPAAAFSQRTVADARHTALAGSLLEVDLSTLECEPDMPLSSRDRSAAPRVAAHVANVAAAGWGELMREPARSRPDSVAMPGPARVHESIGGLPSEASQVPDATSFGAFSLPPEERPLVLQVQSVVPLRAMPRVVEDPPPVTRLSAERGPVPAERGSVEQAKAPARSEDDSDYWAHFSAVLAVPWRERGLAWFLSIGAWAVFANLFAGLALIVPVVGTGFVFLLNTSVLALCADFHRRCMWAVANGEDAIEEGPDFDPVRILHQYMRAGKHLFFFLVASQLPVFALLVMKLADEGGAGVLDLVLSKRTWLLAAVPGMYWPMAVATASLHNRFQGVWDVPLGFRALLRAPLEYGSIALIGALMFLFPWAMTTLIGRALGLPGMSFIALASLPLAASHGTMGALTGQLMRAKPALFE
jgi:hypothetical protein